MAQVHMTEAEVARDLHGVLANVQQGVEVVVVEQDHRPVAVIGSPLPKGRLLSSCIALAEARGSTATLRRLHEAHPPKFDPVGTFPRQNLRQIEP